MLEPIDEELPLGVTWEIVDLCVARHLSGDWGDVDRKLRKQNEKNLAAKAGEVVSRYYFTHGVFHISTQFDRRETWADFMTWGPTKNGARSCTRNSAHGTW